MGLKAKDDNRGREDQNSEIEETRKKNKEMNQKIWQWWGQLEKMNGW